VLRRGRKNEQALLPCHYVGPLSFELLDAPANYREFGRVFDNEDLAKGLLLRVRNRTATATAPTLLLPRPLLPPMPRREATDDTLNRRNYISLSTLHAPHRRQRS
jgi:hypothetical protein